jgi:hypothetical protein
MDTKFFTKSRWGFAKMQLLLGMAVLMMLVPTFLYLAGPLRQPLLTQGDRIEDRTCPMCKGLKRDCPRCKGTGVVPFVVPGLLRPTNIIGHVYGPDQAVVPQAAVSIQTSAGTIELKTDEQGRFGACMPPGEYPMTIQSSKGQLQDKLKVAVLKVATPADLDLTFPSEQRAIFLQQKK